MMFNAYILMLKLVYQSASNTFKDLSTLCSKEVWMQLKKQC